MNETTPTPEAAVTAKATKAAPKKTTAKKTTAKKTAAKKTTTAKAAPKKTTAKKTTAKKTTTPKVAPTKTSTTTEHAPTGFSALVDAVMGTVATESVKLFEAPVARARTLMADLPEVADLRSRFEGQLVMASKSVEDVMKPYVAAATERSQEGRTAAHEAAAPMITSVTELLTGGRKAVEANVTPYVATVSAQAREAVETAEKFTGDLRARADARAAFATGTAADLKTRAEAVLASLREVVGR